MKREKLRKWLVSSHTVGKSGFEPRFDCKAHALDPWPPSNLSLSEGRAGNLCRRAPSRSLLFLTVRQSFPPFLLVTHLVLGQVPWKQTLRGDLGTNELLRKYSQGTLEESGEVESTKHVRSQPQPGPVGAPGCKLRLTWGKRAGFSYPSHPS